MSEKIVLREITYEQMSTLVTELQTNNFVKDKEIERLNKELEVAKTNEETYRLEMLDITKRLGLDEETLFDDVKDKAERLNNIINELEKYCNEEIEDYNEAINSKILSEIGRDKYEAKKMCFLDILDKLQELKGSDSNE